MAETRVDTNLNLGGAARVTGMQPGVGLSDAATLAQILAPFFGDGSDGDVTIISGTTTLTRDMAYNNLTLSGTGKIITSGYRVFVKGTLDLSNAPAGAIVCNGLVGTSGQGNGGNGNGGATDHSVNAPISPGGTATGGSGGTAAGSAGQGGGVTVGLISGGHPVGGVGGAGLNGVGGAGSPAVTVPGSGSLSNLLCYLTDFFAVSNGTLSLALLARGCGGGGGGGDGTAGGGGGGAGGRGGAVLIYAALIQRGANVTPAILQAKGNIGGAGGAPPAGNRGGGGGGSGGSGGFVYIVFGLLLGATIVDAIDVSGGAGGNGGNGFGTGIGGGGGGRGGRGRVILLNILSAVASVLSPDSGGAGSPAIGATGGAGAAAVVSRFAL